MSTAEATTLNSIVEALSGVVGKENVNTDIEVLTQYSKDTSLMPARMPDMVVKAMTRDEVMGVIKIANQNGIPVVPRSSGTGTYGSGIPVQGGIILDLSQMKRIPRIDTRNRWALFEAGTTFGELKEELDKLGMQTLNPLLPRKDKSIMTSVLEREPVLCTKTETDEPFRTMECVWGTGEMFRTGAMCVDSMPAEEIPEKTKSDLCSIGGPGLDWWRLLTGCQGTFSVGTIMNVKIFHKPLLQKIVFLPFDNLEDAVKPYYKMMHREIGHECFLLNGYDLAAILAENDEDIAALASKMPNYCIVMNLWGGQFFPEERLAFEEKAVYEIADQFGCTVSDGLKALPDANVRLQNMLNGPWEGDVHWKERQKGGCLEMVFHSGLDKIPGYWELLKNVAGEYGIDVRELGLYIQPRQRARVCHVEIQIPCDPEDAASIDNVKAFHRKAFETLLNAGALFYRPYYDWADAIYARSGYTFETIKKLKNIIDPNHTLNPGKIGL
ncbi:MAG: FAD-binding oxidoreductase [Deltaproteobacteria bacterium]|nr:FAD-binding oxidoreductase [Deltaproteobacteria bacterium]